MPDALTTFLEPDETKDITSASGGTFTLPAFGSGAISRPNIIATPVEHALRNMVKVHNAVHGTAAGKRADLPAVRAVYRRGAKAYSKRRHPASSRRKWAMQRVKNHLSMLASGNRPHARYTQDDDLLPHGHPLAKSTKGERKALLIIEGRHDELGIGEPITVEVAAFLLEGKGYFEALASLEVKGVWDPDKHPRDYRGRFIHIGAAVAAMIDGKQQEGTVLSMSRGNVTVRTPDGTEHVVKAAQTQVTDHAGGQMSLLEQARAHTDADAKARQLERSGHPEAAAWSQRRDALAQAIKGRVQAGESIHDPYMPPGGGVGGDDISTPEALHTHLTAGHGGQVLPFGQQEMAAHEDLHARAHDLGADHVHPGGPPPPPAAPTRPGDAATRPDGTEWGSGYSPGDPRNNPAYDKYVANLDGQNAAALSDVGDTQTVHDHVDGVAGAYQPDRQAQHDAILDELMTRYKDMPRQRKAIMLAGPSGAGKSTTIKLLGHQFGVESKEENGQVIPTNFATVNPDDIKEMMVKRGLVDPDKYGKYEIGPGEGMTLIHEESSDIAKRLQNMLIAHGTNVLVDGTFAGKFDKNEKKIRNLRAAGYTVTGVLVDGDIERSLTNAGKRHTKVKTGVAPDTDLSDASVKKPFQGRYVPLGHIEAQRPAGYYSDMMDRPHRSQNAENFEQAKDVFNGGVRVYDNSSGEAKLVYSEEPKAGSEPEAEGLPSDALDRLKHGTTGKVSSGDLHGVIAQALSRAASEDRPQFIQAGYHGYGIQHAPMGFNDYFEADAGGHVTHVHRDTRTGAYTRKPLPVADVHKIVDHYVKPTHMQLPRTRRRTPLPNGERVIHEDGRRGHVEQVTAADLKPGEDLIHPVTGEAQGQVGTPPPTSGRFARFQPEAPGPDAPILPGRGVATPPEAGDVRPRR